MSSEKFYAFISYSKPCAILTLLLVFIPAASPASNSIWINKGPDGGTIWCIAVDPLAPATLYAGTSSGGIFKSTDKGVNWTGASAGLTDFSIMAIAVDPRNSETLYSSTVNAGMFKSTDGGQSWTAISSGLPEFAVGVVAIDPANSDTVYAGTAGAGVLKSTDGGHNWTAINVGLKGKSVGEWGESIVALVIDRQSPGTVYAGTYSDGVFRTDNGGQTWAAVNTGFSGLSLGTLIIDPQDGNVLYAGVYGEGVSEVWKTVNGGGSWNPVAGKGLLQFNVVAGLVIDSNNPETIYVVGYLSSAGMATGIFKSSDGGDSWTVLSNVPDGQIPPLAIDAHDSATLYAGSTNTGMYKSTDGGNTWIHSSRGISSINIFGLSVDRANSNTLYASTSQGVFKSIDGGNTWQLKLSDPTDYPVVIDPGNPATIYVANVDVLKSTDGGASWRLLGGVHSVVALAIDPHNPQTLYAGESDSPFGPPITVNGVSRSDDGGETWRPANGGLPTSRIVFGFVAVDPGNSATVYAATLYDSASQAGGVYRSADGGGTWRLVSDEQFTAVALDAQKSGIIYAGTADKGLLKTVDGGDSWISLDNVLKNKFITALAVSDVAAVLYAGTADGGVFRSTDEGNSWTQLDSGQTMPGILSLAIDPKNAETVYAGTSGGVFKLVPLDSAVKVNVPTGGAAVAATAGTGGSVQSGYATVTIDSGSVASGVAVFSFRQNGIVISEAGVPASPPTRSARIFVEYRAGVAVPGQYAAGRIDVDTGLALVNRGSSGANVTYTLRNIAGTVVAGGHGSLVAGAHFAKFINQLSDVAPDFKLPDDFPTMVQFGSLDINSDQPLSVLALRLTVNQRNDALMTTTPTADLSDALTGKRLIFPHFVDGGGYVTKLILMNTSAAAEAGMISFYDDNGAPLVIKQAGGIGNSSFPYSIQPGGVFVLQADGSPAAVNVGSVQLTPYAGTWTPVSAGVFGFSRNGVLVSESGIPAAEPTTHARIYIDQTGNHGTGLALAALSGSGLDVALKACQMDGSTPAGSAGARVVLNQNGHSARFVSQLIPGLPPDFTGVLDISAEAPFAALTLRSLTNSRGDFLLTTFPVADSNRLPPFLTVFPQIADGGGYVTQFILLSATGTSSATLQLWGNSGTPLAVVKP